MAFYKIPTYMDLLHWTYLMVPYHKKLLTSVFVRRQINIRLFGMSNCFKGVKSVHLYNKMHPVDRQKSAFTTVHDELFNNFRFCDQPNQYFWLRYSKHDKYWRLTNGLYQSTSEDDDFVNPMFPWVWKFRFKPSWDLIERQGVFEFGRHVYYEDYGDSNTEDSDIDSD